MEYYIHGRVGKPIRFTIYQRGVRVLLLSQKSANCRPHNGWTAEDRREITEGRGRTNEPTDLLCTLVPFTMEPSILLTRKMVLRFMKPYYQLILDCHNQKKSHSFLVLQLKM